MPYSKQFVDNIRKAADIVEIIREVVELKATTGDRHKGLCPFHNESSPSFTVNNKLYFCFGCGEGGDVIRFVERTQKISFGASLRYLGDRYGVSVDMDYSYKQRVKLKDPSIKAAEQLVELLSADGYFEREHRPIPLATRDIAADVLWEKVAASSDEGFDLLLDHGIVPTELLLEHVNDLSDLQRGGL